MEDNKFYVLIVGSRGFDDYDFLVKRCDHLLQKHKEIVVVSGGARGADALAKRYAQDKGYEYIEFPADWNKYGKRAGYIRNEEMHKFIAKKSKRGVIAFWDGESKGTKHNFGLAEKYNNQLRIEKY